MMKNVENIKYILKNPFYLLAIITTIFVTIDNVYFYHINAPLITSWSPQNTAVYLLILLSSAGTLMAGFFSYLYYYTLPFDLMVKTYPTSLKNFTQRVLNPIESEARKTSLEMLKYFLIAYFFFQLALLPILLFVLLLDDQSLTVPLIFTWLFFIASLTLYKFREKSIVSTHFFTSIFLILIFYLPSSAFLLDLWSSQHTWPVIIGLTVFAFILIPLFSFRLTLVYNFAKNRLRKEALIFLAVSMTITLSVSILISRQSNTHWTHHVFKLHKILKRSGRIANIYITEDFCNLQNHRLYKSDNNTPCSKKSVLNKRVILVNTPSAPLVIQIPTTKKDESLKGLSIPREHIKYVEIL